MEYAWGTLCFGLTLIYSDVPSVSLVGTVLFGIGFSIGWTIVFGLLLSIFVAQRVWALALAWALAWTICSAYLLWTTVISFLLQHLMQQ